MGLSFFNIPFLRLVEKVKGFRGWWAWWFTLMEVGEVQPWAANFDDQVTLVRRSQQQVEWLRIAEEDIGWVKWHHQYQRPPQKIRHRIWTCHRRGYSNLGNPWLQAEKARTLLETNSSPLKINGWKINFLLGWGKPLVSGSLNHGFLPQIFRFVATARIGASCWINHRRRVSFSYGKDVWNWHTSILVDWESVGYGSHEFWMDLHGFWCNYLIGIGFIVDSKYRDCPDTCAFASLLKRWQ